MYEINNVFNFEIAKLNDRYKIIYLLLTNEITICELKKYIKKIFSNYNEKSSNKEINSILNNIIHNKPNESMIIINIGNTNFNLIISFIDNILYSGIYLFNSLIKNKLRNINIFISYDINLYNFIELFLMQLYNHSNNTYELNFLFNILNDNVINEKIQNIIHDTKCLFMCKLLKNTNIDNINMPPNIKKEEINKIKYIEYKPYNISYSKKIIYYSSNFKLNNILYILLLNNSIKKTNNNIISIINNISFDKLFKYFGKSYIYININKSNNTYLSYSSKFINSNYNDLIKNIINNSINIYLPLYFDNYNDNNIYYIELNFSNKYYLVKLLNNI